MQARAGGFWAAAAAGAALGAAYGLARWFRSHPRADGRYCPRSQLTDEPGAVRVEPSGSGSAEPEGAQRPPASPSWSGRV